MIYSRVKRFRLSIGSKSFNVGMNMFYAIGEIGVKIQIIEQNNLCRYFLPFLGYRF
jgi:hypothetical protein